MAAIVIQPVIWFGEGLLWLMRSLLQFTIFLVPRILWGITKGIIFVGRSSMNIFKTSKNIKSVIKGEIDFKTHINNGKEVIREFHKRCQPLPEKYKNFSNEAIKNSVGKDNYYYLTVFLIILILIPIVYLAIKYFKPNALPDLSVGDLGDILQNVDGSASGRPYWVVDIIDENKFSLTNPNKYPDNCGRKLGDVFKHKSEEGYYLSRLDNVLDIDEDSNNIIPIEDYLDTPEGFLFEYALLSKRSRLGLLKVDSSETITEEELENIEIDSFLNPDNDEKRIAKEQAQIRYMSSLAKGRKQKIYIIRRSDNVSIDESIMKRIFIDKYVINQWIKDNEELIENYSVENSTDKKTAAKNLFINKYISDDKKIFREREEVNEDTPIHLKHIYERDGHLLNNELEYNKMMDTDAINYDPNYKIYFGLIFTDGYGIFEDNENVNKINSYCESFNREGNILNCDKKGLTIEDRFNDTNFDYCQLTSLGNQCIANNNCGNDENNENILCENYRCAPINNNMDMDYIFDKGEEMFEECPPPETRNELIYGLYQFKNPEVSHLSEQSLLKYDEIHESNILNTSTHGLEYTGMNTSLTQPYNHLCNPTPLSGSSEREVYCTFMKNEEDNCIVSTTNSFDVEITKQCYDNYPKIVFDLPDTEDIPVASVVKIGDNGVIEKIRIDKPILRTEPVEFYIKREIQDDADTSDITRGVLSMNEQGIIDYSGTNNINYRFFKEIKKPDLDKSVENQCEACFINTPLNLSDVNMKCNSWEYEIDCQSDINCEYTNDCHKKECSGIVDENECLNTSICEYDGTICKDIDCDNKTIQQCTKHPSCRWIETPPEGDTNTTGKCVADLKLKYDKHGEKRNENVIDFEKREFSTEIDYNYNCFDDIGNFSKKSETLDGCSTGEIAVYNSKIEKAMKLIYPDCEDNNCRNNFSQCVGSEDESGNKIIEGCPIDNTLCDSTFNLSPTLGGPDYYCSDASCLVPTDGDANIKKVMPLSKRQCENRNTREECIDYDNEELVNRGCRWIGNEDNPEIGRCEINPNSVDKYDCIYDGDYGVNTGAFSFSSDSQGNINYLYNINQVSVDTLQSGSIRGFLGDEEDVSVDTSQSGSIVKQLNCKRFKENNPSRGGQFRCDTCDQIDELGNLSNPCPNGYDCVDDSDNSGAKYCVDNFLPNMNAYLINDEICFPPFYGVIGGSMGESAELEDGELVRCLANPDSNHMYKKNGSPMLPHVFYELFSTDEKLRTRYSEFMRELDKGGNIDTYFDKETKSGKLYELLEEYFNMNYLDYCSNIFTEETYLINPLEQNVDENVDTNSLYYPSWRKLKNNILSSANASSIFSFLNSSVVSGDDSMVTGVEIACVDNKTLDNPTINPTCSSDGEFPVNSEGYPDVMNWDNQICIMQNGVEEPSERCSGITNWTKQLCDEYNGIWDPLEEKCKKTNEEGQLVDTDINDFLSVITEEQCLNNNGIYTQAQTLDQKRNNRLVPVSNDKQYCSICRKKKPGGAVMCQEVDCGIGNENTTACNPDGTCNCYNSVLKYGTNCQTSMDTLGDDRIGDIGGQTNQIIHPDNSYSYLGLSDSARDLPMGFNLMCKGGHTDKSTDNGPNDAYIGQQCEKLLKQVCYSRKTIFTSNDYSKSLQFLNILDMDTFIENMKSGQDLKYTLWPFYHNSEINIPYQDLPSKLITKEELLGDTNPGLSSRLTYDNDITCSKDICIKHPINQARILHTIALYMFDPFIKKTHYNKLEQPELVGDSMDIGNEVAPSWEYNIDSISYEDKLNIANRDFHRLPVENKLKYYALGILTASQYVCYNFDDIERKRRFSHLRLLLCELSETLENENRENKNNFYKAYFRIVPENVEDDMSVVNCDCTRPNDTTDSSQQTKGTYTFMKNYNPDDVTNGDNSDLNQLRRWALKAPLTQPNFNSNDTYYYHGDRCEYYDVMGSRWQNDNSPFTNEGTIPGTRCNADPEYVSSPGPLDYPRQVSTLYSYKEGSQGFNENDENLGEPNIVYGDGTNNIHFLNPSDYYDGSELSYLNKDENNECMNKDGTINLLCGDKESIKNEFNYQKVSSKNRMTSIFNNKTAEEYIDDNTIQSHLPDVENMPEINLVERLRISKSPGICDCSFSQYQDSGKSNTSQWGQYCNYKAQDICNTSHMESNSGDFSYDGTYPTIGDIDNYMINKRKRQVNAKGDYTGLIYSGKYVNTEEREENYNKADIFNTVVQNNIPRGNGIDFTSPTIMSGSRSVNLNSQEGWYKEKMDAGIPVIRNPDYKNTIGEGQTYDDEIFSLCKCVDNSVTRFSNNMNIITEGDITNYISCNTIGDNCLPDTCGHINGGGSGTGYGAYSAERGSSRLSQDEIWDCDENPLGLSPESSDKSSGTSQIDNMNDPNYKNNNTCECNPNNYQDQSKPSINCDGICCPNDEDCGFVTSGDNKGCIRVDTDYGPSKNQNGNTLSWGRKEKMNANAYLNEDITDTGDKHIEYYKYEPICEDNCYYSTHHSANFEPERLDSLLTELDSDWDATLTTSNTDLKYNKGLIKDINYDCGWWCSTMDKEDVDEVSNMNLGISDEKYSWKKWFTHSIPEELDVNITLENNNARAKYKCVPEETLIKASYDKVEEGDGNAWISFYDYDYFIHDVEEIFENSKEMFLLKDFKNNLYATGTHYYNVSGWDDSKPPEKQIMGTNYTVKDGSGADIHGDESGRAPADPRNPLFMLAKQCCSETLKVERRSQGGVNELRVSCNRYNP